MNPAYKLVVVQPFGSYQRGYTIYDQKVVSAILDVNDEMHHYEQHVRRVPLRVDEHRMAFPSAHVVEHQPTAQPIESQLDAPVDAENEEEFDI